MAAAGGSGKDVNVKLMCTFLNVVRAFKFYFVYIPLLIGFLKVQSHLESSPSHFNISNKMSHCIYTLTSLILTEGGMVSALASMCLTWFKSLFSTYLA